MSEVKKWSAAAISALSLATSGATPSYAQTATISPTATSTLAVSISTGTTTLLIGGVSGQRIYVTSADVIAAGTGNIQFEYGTGTTCGGGTTNLTGNYNLIAQTGFTKGAGVGPIWVVPAGNSLCAVTNNAVGMAGSLSYAQF